MGDNRFFQFQQEGSNEELTVCGIPFSVKKDENGVVQKVQQDQLDCPAACDTLFFLGMATDANGCSEWWAQQEVMYDYSDRVFIGDRLMRIHVLFEDKTEELISVIFGVNAWNYNLYCRLQDRERLPAWDGPYEEPFASDPEAKAMKEKSLRLMENTSPEAQKCTKWVFGYRIRPGKKIKSVSFTREEGKRSGVAISAVTGLRSGEAADPGWVLTDQDFFLRKDYYAAADRLARRLYQFRDELPESDPKKEIEGFDAPDLTFTGTPMAEVYTNVYRMNIMDMARNKVDTDGQCRTSSVGSVNFSFYTGLGTFRENVGSYSGHVWTRDVGRTLMELVNLGCDEKLPAAADYLHTLLYYKSIRFCVPRWKRVANLVAKDENDLFNEGNENDGHASIMLFIYSLYRKGITDVTWLKEHEKQLRDASDYYLWQKEHPEESNYNGMLYSMSEASTQNPGGYDVFSNLLSSYALKGYARLFEAMGDPEYAGTLTAFSEDIRKAVSQHFTMDHPRYGKVLTDSTHDCWTYEYKRMADLLVYSDLFGYDMAAESPELFDLMTRTFLAQKEAFYAPESGRQMGYGQGYLTQSAIMLDKYEEMTECMEAAAMFCYHHTDHSYIVPEGVIIHGSKRFWFRNCDQGNAVQQAEIVKCARLLTGIDDILPERGLRLIPRLPNGWDSITAKDYPVTTKARDRVMFSFSYTRGISAGKITASSGECAYTADWSGKAAVEYIRMGPFQTREITVSAGKITEVKKIQDNYFAYVKPDPE